MIKKWDEFIKESFNTEDRTPLVEEAFGKIDYYYLESNVDLSIVREKYNLIEDNAYRAFATFAENIKHFQELPCEKIALVNYPPTRHNKTNLKNKINEVKNLDIDEIEFPWNNKYKTWGKDFWRKLILDCSNNGIKLRPMLEVGIQKDIDVKETLDFLREVGIYSIMTSTGLIPEITTIDKWNSIRDYMPRMFEVKVGGILTMGDINKFIKSNVDLSATTMDFKINYSDKKE